VGRFVTAYGKEKSNQIRIIYAYFFELEIMDTKVKETKLLGSLMPSHPDLIPIIQNFREKYNIPEISLVVLRV
jgi:hypothetical protein